MKPLVSIVVPTYKRPLYLERAIASVLAQSYPSWELIIVDDNVEGGEYRRETEAFMMQYADNPRIRYLKHASNRGGSAARNTGIRAANGSHVAFLDDDDEWLPTKLEEQMACFARGGSRLGLVYSGTMVVDSVAGMTYREEPQRRGRLFPQLLARNCIGSTSTVLCTKQALIEAGLFDESLKSAQDFDLYLGLAKIYDIDFVDKPLVVRHKHPEERITHNHNNKIAAFETIYHKHRAVLEDNPGLHSKFLVQQGKLLMRIGDKMHAKQKFALALRCSPLQAKVLGFWLLSSLGFSSYRAVQVYTRPVRGFFRRVLGARE